MDDFTLYFTMGLNHVLDFLAYDHILFLIVLTVVFNLKDWKKTLWLITLFTIGHSTTLALSAYEVIKFKTDLIEFLIALTIFISGFLNVLLVKKVSSQKISTNLYFSVFFGLIHGLGFSSYFKMMIGKEENKFLPLLEFALGIEISQVIIVSAVLIIGTLLQRFFKITKRDWVLVCSSIVVGFSIQMMVERAF